MGDQEILSRSMSTSELYILDFGQVNTTPISKIFGQKSQPKTNTIKKIYQKILTQYQYKSTFGATSRPKTDTTLKNFSWRTNTTPIQQEMAIYGQFFQKNPIFWPFFSKFCQILVIFDNF